MRTSTLIIAAIAIASLGISATRADPTARVLVSFERGVCYGFCAAYKLTVLADGSLEYRGDHHVKTRGRATAKLSADELATLIKAFETAKFFDLSNVEGGTDDIQYVTTTYDDGKRKRRMVHDSTLGEYGRTAKIKADSATLTTLENTIDQIANTARWVDGGSYR